MGRLQRRQQEAELIALGERYGPAIGLWGESRAQKIEMGRQVVRAIENFDRMRAAGVVERINGVEAKSWTHMIELIWRGFGSTASVQVLRPHARGRTVAGLGHRTVRINLLSV
jgi:hypothetical protein